MTKEEMLLDLDDGCIVQPGISDIVERHNALLAMELFAKQECIEFIKWAVKEYSIPYEGFSLSFNRLLGGETIFVNGDELNMNQFYDLYIKSKNK